MRMTYPFILEKLTGTSGGRTLLLLSGGTGSPKLLRGLLFYCSGAQVTVIANTGDDIWISGNLVCPDLDTVIYTAAGIVSERWWGINGDTFRTHERLASLGHKEALVIGELDRATHIFRSDLLRRGATLTDATLAMCASFEISATVLPMTDDFVPTTIVTDNGEMHIQDFLVRYQQAPNVSRVRCRTSKMTKEVETALDEHRSVVIGPSNPISSIGPILDVNGMRQALKDRFVIAVSPIIRGEPISGPAGKFMESRGLPVSSLGVAEFYSDFLDVLIVDGRDDISQSDLPGDIELLRADTIMYGIEQSKNLATEIVRILPSQS
jgi:LPPG:FO 2-phospho-L-lactate transferase